MLKRFLLICTTGIGALTLNAQITLLDPEFGSGGIAPLVLSGTGGDRANAVALQPDGRIVIAASRGGDPMAMTAVRILSNGSLDNSFSVNGISPAIMGEYGTGRAIAVDPEGRVVLAGSSYFATTFNDIAVARFLPDGMLDSTFSGDGRFSYSTPGGLDAIEALGIYPDGSVLAAGRFNDQPGSDLMALRLLADGTPDPDFAENGFFRSTEHTGEVVEDLALLEDGSALLGGAWALTLPTADLSVLQLDASGAPYAGYGSSGLFRPSEANTTSYVSAMELISDDRLIIGGNRYVPGIQGQDVFLGRVTSVGEWDGTYGNGGRFFLPIGAPYVGELKDFVVLGSGMALVAVDLIDTSDQSTSIMVLRVLPDGGLDVQFGINGRLIMPCPGVECAIEGLALQADQKVVAVGTYSTVDGPAILVMRWLSEASPLGGVASEVPLARFSMAPNPCESELTVRYGGSLDRSGMVDLLDLSGRSIARWPAEQVMSGTELHLPLPAVVGSGTYVMSIPFVGAREEQLLMVIR